MSAEWHTLTDQMRQAAMVLEQVSKLYGWNEPAKGEWSATQLRREADMLDRPIPGQAS